MKWLGKSTVIAYVSFIDILLPNFPVFEKNMEIHYYGRLMKYELHHGCNFPYFFQICEN